MTDPKKKEKSITKCDDDALKVASLLGGMHNEDLKNKAFSDFPVHTFACKKDDLDDARSFPPFSSCRSRWSKSCRGFLRPHCWSFCALQKNLPGVPFPNARRNERVWGDLAPTTGCMHLKNSEEGSFFLFLFVQFVNFFPSISILTLSAEQEGFFAPSVCCGPLLWGGPQEEANALWSERKEHTKRILSVSWNRSNLEKSNGVPKVT